MHTAEWIWLYKRFGYTGDYEFPISSELVQRRPEAFGEPGAKHQFEAKMTKLQGIGPYEYDMASTSP